ncbi:MAG: HEAT repeat domain-containing protein [Planctomycetota bacterium]|jgi:hypothetical protein
MAYAPGSVRVALGALVVLAAAVLAPLALADFKDAQKKAARALDAKDAAGLRSAIDELGRENTDKAVKLLLKIAGAAQTLDVRESLIEAFGAQTSKKAVKALLRGAQKDKDWAVRFLVMEALPRLQGDAGEEALIAGVSDKDSRVASQAMRVAAEHGVKRAIPAMIEQLEAFEKKPSGREKVGSAALLALKELTGEQIEDAFGWQSWWKVNHDQFDPANVARGTGKNSSGGATVLRRIKKRGEQEFIEKLEKGDIFCVTGEFDHVENVLSSLKLPHTVVKRENFGKEVMNIPPTAVIIFNCAGGETPLPGEAVTRLQALVKAGAYMFTSDWELQNTVLRAVPGHIGMGATTAEHKFPIQIGAGAENHPYMRDVFPDDPFKAAQMTWQIDGASYCVKANGEGVRVLVRCEELLKQYASEIVACTFRYGKGSVLHVLSHFDKQSDAAGDGFALQQMLMNFIVEKQKFRKRKK